MANGVPEVNGHVGVAGGGERNPVGRCGVKGRAAGYRAR